MTGNKGHQKSRKQRKQTGFKELAHICVLCSAIASPSLLSSSPIRVNSIRGCSSVSACLWDVCGFVAPLLVPRRFRFRRAVWVCVLGPGLGCSWLCCRGVFFAPFFFFLFSFFWVFLSRALWSLSPHPLSFGLGWWLSLFFFSACFGVPFPGGPLFLAWCCRFRVGGPPVPLWGSCLRCLLGGGCLAASGGVGGRFGGCGLFSRLFPLPPRFFGGGGLACSSLCLPWAGARTGLHSVLSSGLLF